MRQQLSEILTQVLVFLTIFLIGALIYRTSNPYSYLGLENRILFVLVLLGIVLLYLYLEEKRNRNHLFSVITITANRLRESKSMRICEEIWSRSPSLIRTRISKVLAVLHPYLNAMSKYILKQDPKEVVSYAFLGMLLMVALQSVFPQPSLEWARTPVMIAAVVFGAITFYLNRDKLGEIEDEARQEKLEENLRKMEFGDKYPRINRVWGVRWVVKWMYKEGCLNVLILFFIILIYGFIVFNKLGNFGFQVDEFYHALIAKNWFEHHELFKLTENYTYFRGPLVSILAILSKTIFPFFNDEFAYRLPIAISGIVNVILIYTLSKEFMKKDISLLITLLFATDIWFIEFARYLRFYTLAITIILLLLIYVIKNNQSLKALNISFCLSIGFYFLLTEYFLFIAFFFGLVLSRKLWLKDEKKAIQFLLVSLFIFIFLIIYRIIQMGDYIITYNFLDYNLFDLTYTIAHFKWLNLNYWFIVIGICILTPTFLKLLSNPKKSKSNSDSKTILFSFVLFNLLVIFGYIDHVNYNFTLRPFLFVLPVGIIASAFVFYNILFHKKIFVYSLFLILIIFNCHIILSYSATEHGDELYPYKLFFEKQQLIIDTKTPNIFVENYINSNNITKYSTFIIAINEYPFVYYTNLSPTYLIRWKGSVVDGLSTIGTPVIFNPDVFFKEIQTKNSEGNDVFLVTYATIYPIKNPLYKLMFDKDYALEAHGSIAQRLNNDYEKYKIYIGMDNLSSVYYIPSDSIIY